TTTRGIVVVDGEDIEADDDRIPVLDHRAGLVLEDPGQGTCGVVDEGQLRAGGERTRVRRLVRQHEPRAGPDDQIPRDRQRGGVAGPAVESETRDGAGPER